MESNGQENSETTVIIEEKEEGQMEEENSEGRLLSGTYTGSMKLRATLM